MSAVWNLFTQLALDFEISKPPLPELTPETKGIAEGDRPFSCA
jgi:hypothetical protein